MIASIIVNYLLGVWLDNVKERRSAAKLAIVIAVLFNIGLLAAFKYANFIVNNLNTIFLNLKIPSIELAPVHLPIGISFFTFQALTYVIDIYRGQSKAQKNPLNAALYISFFPQLIAGPIVRYHDIAKQITKRYVKTDDLIYGIKRFVIGLGKKVLIANTVALVADKIFALPAEQLGFSTAWLGIICYTLQIYFDFSGYSDMAIGLGRMFGFHFLENFNYPYIAKSIKEFWKRWHISLSGWFRDYLYIPLGGSRVKSTRVYFNLLIVFFLCGLWHGASWGFVIWGLYHGFFLILERIWLGEILEETWKPIRHLYTIIIVSIGWVFFRADTLSYALSYLETMFDIFKTNSFSYPIQIFLNNKVIIALFIGIIGSLPLIPKISQYYTNILCNLKKPQKDIIEIFSLSLIIIVIIIIFIASAMLLASGTYNPFIYFRF